MEAYNIKSNEWFHVAPMNTRRSSVGVGVVGGKTGSPHMSVSSALGSWDPEGASSGDLSTLRNGQRNSFGYIFLF